MALTTAYYVGGAAAAAFAVQEITDKGRPQAPQAPGAPQIQQADRETPEVKAAVDQQRKRLRASRGRQSTILTGGNQLGEPRTDRKTILGS